MSNFNDLQNQYNSILTQYQQTYQDYLQSLDSSANNFVTVPNASFWGTSAISSQQLSNIDDCVNSCVSTSSCSGATYNTSSQSCSLRQGNGNIISTMSAESAIVPSSLQYSYQLKQLNQQLLDLNQQMSTSLQQSNQSYQTNVKPQKQQQEQILNNNNGILQEDREKIHMIIREFQMLNEADKNSQIVVTQEYSSYIVYLLVAILLIILILKFSVFSGEQRGGGTKHFYKDFFILLGIYFFGFMVLQYLQKINIYTILSLFVIMYLVLLGMKG
jgi:hypothetical protein